MVAVLARRIPWQDIEASLAYRFARAAKVGKQIEYLDLFGAAAVVLSAVSVSKGGRPRLSLRLTVALRSLKNTFNESDEALVERFGETPTWQYFSGMAYFEHRWPCHLKADHRMNRCHLLGAQGDSLHTVLCAAGVQHPLAAADDCQEGRTLFADPFLRPPEHSGLTAMGRWAAKEMAKLGA
jgi:hypothetical protein